ncbi:MAG: NAD-dependent epimerase/dehydratase family protein [Chloroflexi bacterium]|nr:NAD-dependent epimerase/dehydratase family protein [Chloroflexota bacterium]
MKNVLVIGGSYFVGRVFVEELLQRSECSIHVVNRGNRPLKLEGVNEIVCDRHDAAKLARVVPPLEWDAVVDFCAYSPDDIPTVLQSLQGRVQRYIYISTATVHQNSLVLPMTEDTPVLTTAPPGPAGDYAYKKRLGELRLKGLCEPSGITYVCLRPSFIYGKYNYAPRESYFFGLMARGEPVVLPALPQALFSTVSVWDVARICIACLWSEAVRNNSYIVSAGELLSYDRLVKTLEEIASIKLKVSRQPVRVIEVRGIPLPFPLSEHLVYSGKRLQQALGYEYLPFAEGMRRTYEWFVKSTPHAPA